MSLHDLRFGPPPAKPAMPDAVLHSGVVDDNARLTDTRAHELLAKLRDEMLIIAEALEADSTSLVHQAEAKANEASRLRSGADVIGEALSRLCPPPAAPAHVSASQPTGCGLRGSR